MTGRGLLWLAISAISVTTYGQNIDEVKSASQLQLDTAFILDEEEKFDAAFKYFERAVALDPQNFLAINNVARYYADGKGIEKNTKKALELYQQTAMQGDNIGLWMVGSFYENGTEVPQSDSIAVSYYLKSAGTKNWFSKYPYKSLGDAYLVGRGVLKNDSIALIWYNKAIDERYAAAYVPVGYIYSSRKIYDKALYWYKKAEDAGDVHGIYNMATMYENGKGVKVNYEQAYTRYKKASDMGYTDAQYAIGAMYEHGQGRKIDYAAALQWYTLAATAGNAQAMNNLGSMLYFGQGVEADKTMGVEWFRKAADNGDGWGQFNLGWDYQIGEVNSRDTVKAMALYLMAARQDVAMAMNNYAWLLAVQNQNLDTAEYWIRASIAAKPDYKLSWGTYSEILFRMQRYEEAMVWLKKALKADDGKYKGYYVERWGDIMFKQGSTDEAIKKWKAALKLPEHSAKTDEKIKQQRYIE